MSTVPKFDVVCYLDGRQDSYHLSKTHAGLLELERHGDIHLRFKLTRSLTQQGYFASWSPSLRVSWGSNSESRDLVLDLGDRNQVFNEEALQRADIYYKRNLQQSDLERFPLEIRPRIKPFGLNFACVSLDQPWRILSRTIPDLLLRTLRHPSREFPWLRKRLLVARELMGMLPYPTYEQAPEHHLERVVFTQFVVWASPPSGVRNVEEEVNRPRVELIRALRKSLGKRFFGGLAPTEYAVRNYPDLLSPITNRRGVFIDAGKKALIGVASQPCVDTSSFKFGEYLAASRCIVSPPFTNKLPEPLVDGRNYLSYRTTEECVQRCVELIEDRELAETMRLHNWQYYQSEVAPRAHVLKLLKGCVGP